jgi:hypothetical protein
MKLKKGDRVSENGRKGTVEKMHANGLVVDVLFDDMQYAIRRQIGNVKRVNGDNGMMKLHIRHDVFFIIYQHQFVEIGDKHLWYDWDSLLKDLRTNGFGIDFKGKNIYINTEPFISWDSYSIENIVQRIQSIVKTFLGKIKGVVYIDFTFNKEELHLSVGFRYDDGSDIYGDRDGEEDLQKKFLEPLKKIFMLQNDQKYISNIRLIESEKYWLFFEIQLQNKSVIEKPFRLIYKDHAYKDIM